MTKGYASLVNIVSTIDGEAAQYLLNDAPNLRGFLYIGGRPASSTLNTAFAWANSPYGGRFWHNIHAKLVEMEGQ